MDEPSSPAPLQPPLDVTAMPPLDEVLADVLDHLTAWIPAQRWYAHKGAGTPRLTVRGWAPLRVDSRCLVIDTVLAVQLADSAAALYQVPLVLRPAGAGHAEENGAEIGVIAVAGGPLRVDDATRVPLGRETILSCLVDGTGAIGAGLRISTTGHGRDVARPLGPGATSRLLSGEQSNSSMIFEADDALPVIVKLFRVLQDGENPDVVVQQALTAAGSARVPRVIGSSRLAVDGLRTHGLFAQEFLPGVEDAWRSTVALAATGGDFSAGAAALGAVLAEVHRDLARAMGVIPVDGAIAQEMVSQMGRRLDEVAAAVPAVAAHRPGVEALFAAALTVPWPAMQRIHGDLHLGQVLAVPGRGWVLLDFEGEPLRPLAQRSLPDSPLRDVAGMLRSLDYAAGAVSHEYGRDASPWAARARAAFLEGYRGTSARGRTGTDPDVEADGAGEPTNPVTADSMRILLAAFEADKAVYEALYEARNRPDWLPIPLRALQRISTAAAQEGSAH